MEVSAPPSPDLKRIRREVFRFDAVVSLLIALLLAAGLVLVVLGLAWLSDQVWKPPPAPIEVGMFRLEGDGLEEGMAGDNPELGEGNEVAPDVLSPGEESLAFDQSGIPSTLSSVLDAAGQAAGDLDAPVLQSGPQGSGRGGLPGGTGLRGAGEGGGGTLPRALRWSIGYTGGQSLESYAQQLDFFGIELGVVRGGRVQYVSGLSKGKPNVRQGSGEERRLYFLWKEPARRQADVALLRKAGVAVEGATIAHFYSPALEDQLARLEKEFQGKDAAEITQTRFGIRRSANGFEFYVVGQTLGRGGSEENPPS